MSTVATPQKPWAKRPSDRIREIVILLASILFSFGFVAATELKGKLAYAFVFFVAYGLFTSTFAFISRGAPAAKDAFISTLVSLGAVLTVVPMASILFTVAQKGLPGLHMGILTNDMSMATSTDPIATGGILHAITGTLTMVALALIMSIPIGILTALYLTEIKGRLAGPIRYLG
jgi:phosphate transport system permease protein